MKPMSSRRTFFGTAAGAAALACLPRRTTAQEAYPTRPVHVIVGFTPGTAADITARVVANGAGAALGQQIVIENKPGAGSSVAAEYVARAANDGYTLFLPSASIVTHQVMNPDRAFDLVRDFAPIALLASGVRPGPEIELAFDVRKMALEAVRADSRDVRASVESVGQQIRQTKDTIAGFVQRPLDTATEHLLLPAVLSVLRGLRTKKVQS